MHLMPTKMPMWQLIKKEIKKLEYHSAYYEKI
jgi:hypothetical protein